LVLRTGKHQDSKLKTFKRVCSWLLDQITSYKHLTPQGSLKARSRTINSSLRKVADIAKIEYYAALLR